MRGLGAQLNSYVRGDDAPHLKGDPPNAFGLHYFPDGVVRRALYPRRTRGVTASHIYTPHAHHLPTTRQDSACLLRLICSTTEKRIDELIKSIDDLKRKGGDFALHDAPFYQMKLDCFGCAACVTREANPCNGAPF